jgi:hypothetical protein
MRRFLTLKANDADEPHLDAAFDDFVQQSIQYISRFATFTAMQSVPLANLAGNKRAFQKSLAF